jgi:hypothetical protein
MKIKQNVHTIMVKENAIEKILQTAGLKIRYNIWKYRRKYCGVPIGSVSHKVIHYTKCSKLC